MPIMVIPSGAALGAEITGVDLSQKLDDKTFGAIEDALHQHSVIWLRRQKITKEQQIDFSRRFGVLEFIPDTTLSGYPELNVVSNILDERGKPIGLIDAGTLWHTDMSYVETPSRVSILHALEVPHGEDGRPRGATNFASTAAAYEALSDSMKRRVAGLKAVHRHVHYLEQTVKAGLTSGRPTRALDLEKKRAMFPDVVHPVIRTHPATGRKCIFVTEGESVAILGMPDDDARELIKELSDQCTRPEFLYTHQWQVGDVLMWDNCSTLHRATFDYALPQRRLMMRTTVRGSMPF